ncbi:Tim44/TimA family putative adaptor protein [Inquilinus limosus]|uniref:Tim44/TimA family putative adaptor protein n=1 Tax=Inquilinus limosus TaxID=171674 RepID=UPI00040A215A|nr:Tim44/TimA family putative adaptor protein [Inquilinus limosus]
MGEGSFLDILVLAVIAGFLILRLRSVLGRRTGTEQRRPNPLAQPPARPEPRTPDNVVNMPERPRAAGNGEAGPASGLTQIKIADRSFSEGSFLGGARGAFKMIVEAFARGDTATLRPLLSDELYDEFSAAIRERLAAGHTLDETVEAVDRAEIVEARLDGRTAFVTVRFVSHQKSVLRDAEGKVVEGNPDQTVEVTDVWTFARNTRATDPNWALVETRESH